MSRGPEEVNRLTESTYRNVMEQFNPGLRNLINLGKNYEKAVNAMILAGKAYYDGVAKIGEIATGSPVSTELGHVLIEISSTHKKLNESLDENFKKFHKEIIHELEKKIELDVKYMNATLKRYQTEHKNKLESLEKSQAELKKIRRKSQGSRNALKYEHKEIEYVETVTSRQSEIQKFIADGCKEALLEEKRRFCFLVDKHCGFANHIHYYHLQSAELLNSKLPRWQETCVDAIKVPEKIMNMIEEIKTPASTPVSGTPQPSPMIERSNVVRKDYDTLSKCSPKMPPAPSGRAYTSPLIDMFNNPATAAPNSQRVNNSTGKEDFLYPGFSPWCTGRIGSYVGLENECKVLLSGGTSEDPSLQRSVSVATGLNMMKKQKVKTIFPHTAGSNKTLLSFAQGDVITLLIPEEKDGWLYGEHDVSKARGWFPSSYTKLLEENETEAVTVPTPSPAPVRSISTVNLSENSSVVIPPPDYLECLSMGAAADRRADSARTTSTFKAPASKPETEAPNDANGTAKPPFLSGENPFATVKLRPTVTNDRSAPIIR
ncbi:BAR/IMD domain-containing adapter protein 2-like 1 isoform X1 [Gorilla gorilla gorilla]|uniref:BAR/IMD domain-containing adapter protein 2-like 1 isoform X1 n=1 Tax=Gorilla gorilla gorilla TaxID=9595 RepID=UPI002445606F|nr:brain-specific angiogenesis inhibitor 1-associated protein 2-like protein 1 isoform X2 [Gorilla gorilla gorilla]